MGSGNSAICNVRLAWPRFALDWLGRVIFDWWMAARSGWEGLFFERDDFDFI